jgi:hypothetical protein
MVAFSTLNQMAWMPFVGQRNAQVTLALLHRSTQRRALLPDLAVESPREKQMKPCQKDLSVSSHDQTA